MRVLTIITAVCALTACVSEPEESNFDWHAPVTGDCRAELVPDLDAHEWILVAPPGAAVRLSSHGHAGEALVKFDSLDDTGKAVWPLNVIAGTSSLSQMADAPTVERCELHPLRVDPAASTQQ